MTKSKKVLSEADRYRHKAAVLRAQLKAAEKNAEAADERMREALASKRGIQGWELERLGGLDLRVSNLEKLREGEWKNILARFDADYNEHMRGMKEAPDAVRGMLLELENRTDRMAEEQSRHHFRLGDPEKHSGMALANEDGE